MRREQDEYHNGADEIRHVYHMGGPFLAKWLIEKQSSNSRGDLESAFGSLFDCVFLPSDLSRRDPRTSSVILNRLAAEWHRPIFDIPGKPLAMDLVRRFKTRLMESYSSTIIDAGSLVAGAAMMRCLGQGDAAHNLYHRALLEIRIPEGPPISQDMRTAVSLAMGLSAMVDSESKNAGVSLLGKIVDKYSTSKDQAWSLVRVVHKLAETIYKKRDLQGALAVVDRLPPAIAPDALLLQLKGDILAAANKTPNEANNCFKQSIAAARGDAARNPQTLFNCLLHYADFLVSHSAAGQSRENPDPYLNEAEDFFNKRRHIDSYEVLLNIRAKVRRSQEDFPGAKKIYESCVSYCREKGFIHSHSWNDYAKLLIDHGGQFKEKPYAAWLAEAELLCHEVIDDPAVDVDSRRATAHILGGLVGGGVSYTFNSQDRPNFSEAAQILQDAFESLEPDRNDGEKKTWQDAITHRMLKDTYLRWYDSDTPAPGGKDKDYLLAKVDFHFQQAFSGLPRLKLRTPDVIEHALPTQSHYAGFLWQVRAGTPDLEAADRHYRDAIEKYETFSHKWPTAYELYEFYANFLHSTGRAAPLRIADILRKAMQLVPPDKRAACASISRKLAHNLHTDLINSLGLLPTEVQGTKLDEVIRLFAQSLTLGLNTDDANAVAGELGHVLFAKRHGILKHLCTKSRVNAVTTALWRSWETYPTNGAALEGILDIADSIIAGLLHDDSELNKLATQIEAKAVNDPTAAEVRVRICEERRADPHRGKLTTMLSAW